MRFHCGCERTISLRDIDNLWALHTRVFWTLGTRGVLGVLGVLQCVGVSGGGGWWRDAAPLFHRTDVVLMVKGNAAFLASLSSPHRRRPSVPDR